MSWTEIFSKPEIIWFFVGLVLALLEFGIPGLIILFFGIGAWVTALSCFMFDIGINTQIIIFIISSLLSIVLLRNSLRKMFFKEDPDKEETLADEFIGQTAVVEELITEYNPGKVSFKGVQWDAFADHELQPGLRVQIIGKESIRLKVAAKKK